MSTLELFRLNLGVDDLVARIGQLEAELAKSRAEVERLRRLAERPVSWASPAGPQSVSVIGRFTAPGGAGPEADGEEAPP